MRRLEYDDEFFFLRSSFGTVSKGATPVKYTDICHFEQIGINAEKFQNTRIRFNSDVFANLIVVTFNTPYIPNKPVTSILALLKLLWSKEENYDDSLEELFIPQNIVDLKVIRCKVFTSNFGFKISGDLTKPGAEGGRGIWRNVRNSEISWLRPWVAVKRSAFESLCAFKSTISLSW